MSFKKQSLHIFCFLFLLVTFFIAPSSWANDSKETAEKIPAGCQSDVKLYCEKVESSAEKLRCLFSNKEKLTAPCQQEVMRVIRALEQAQEQAEGSLVTPSALSSFNPPFTVFSFSGRYSPGNNTYQEGRGEISTPLLKSKASYMALSLSGSQSHFGKSILLGSDTVVADTLSRASLGLQYSEQLSGYRNWGIRGSFGYAGDKINGWSDAVYNIILNYGYPTMSRNFWMWNLVFSNNSPFPQWIPLPGVVYITRSPTFTGMYGIPMTSLQWTPSKKQAYSFSVLLLNLTAEAAWGEITAYQFYAAAKWANQNFIISNRKENDDRLTFEEKRAGLGFRTFCFDRMQFELEAGYVFDRILFAGQGMRNMRSGVALFDSDWYATSSVKVGF